MKNKKLGQVPATLTWISAVLIILFIMVLFLAATGYLSSKKEIPLVSNLLGLQDHINFVGGSLLEVKQGDLRAQKIFSDMMLSSVGNDCTYVKEFLETDSDCQKFITTKKINFDKLSYSDLIRKIMEGEPNGEIQGDLIFGARTHELYKSFKKQNEMGYSQLPCFDIYTLVWANCLMDLAKKKKVEGPGFSIDLPNQGYITTAEPVSEADAYSIKLEDFNLGYFVKVPIELEGDKNTFVSMRYISIGRENEK